MRYTKFYINFMVIFVLALLLNTSIVYAQNEVATTTDETVSKIDEAKNKIKQLDEEIKGINLEIDNVSKQGVTLKNTIKTLDLTKKKITTDISLTEKKITKAVLTIDQLGVEINKTQNNIDVNREAIINAIKETYALEEMNVVQVILSNKDIGEIWRELDYIQETQNILRDKSKELTELKNEMRVKLSNLKGEKNSLVSLKQDLNGKKQAVVYTTKEKEDLLKATKSKEEAFKEIVKTKEELKAQFEKEVYDYESKLDFVIDESKYPSSGHGILSWPLDNVYITQKFGKTVAAKKLYVSGSHNGIDLRASTGTRVKNVLSGVVAGTGNTDIYSGCYSFGKWVMVKHDNGLSTIYGHLSVISVSTGQRLETADLIGYSGNTGYSTGPHLHIGVYATQGVRIEKYVSSRGCKQATMPLADIKAYLDPLAYFPN